MKNSILLMAGLALGAVLLPGTAFAEKKTPFTATETDQTQNFPWFPGTDGNWYVFDGSATFDMVSDEPRVAGRGEYSMYAIMDVTGALTLWGKFHSGNTDGAWDGYYTGTEAGFTATCVGSGKYEGLVSRWQWTPAGDGNGVYHWKGYIVENGPGYVPLKISGMRSEIDVPITYPTPTDPSFYVKASLVNGWGQASHIGVLEDVKELGLAFMVIDPNSGKPFPLKGRAMGIAKAANGDLLNCVSFGGMTVRGFEVQVFFAGGTGRFEHAVGFFTGQIEWTSETSYTYTGTGKIRY